MKNRNQLGTTIDAELHEKLKVLAKNRGVKIWKLVDEAVEMLLQSYNQPKTMPRDNNSRNLGETREIRTRYGTVQDLTKESLSISDEELDEMEDAISLLRAKKEILSRAIREYKPSLPNFDIDLSDPIELTDEEKRELILKRQQKILKGFEQIEFNDDTDKEIKQNTGLTDHALALFELVDEAERKNKKGTQEQISLYDDVDIKP
ncbi:ribbon-helix-helix domain-containing protein, partial [Streptomyces sp. NPDC057927]